MYIITLQLLGYYSFDLFLFKFPKIYFQLKNILSRGKFRERSSITLIEKRNPHKSYGNWISMELAENLICCRSCPDEKFSQEHDLLYEPLDLYETTFRKTS